MLRSLTRRASTKAATIETASTSEPTSAAATAASEPTTATANDASHFGAEKGGAESPASVIPTRVTVADLKNLGSAAKARAGSLWKEMQVSLNAPSTRQRAMAGLGVGLVMATPGLFGPGADSQIPAHGPEVGTNQVTTNPSNGGPTLFPPEAIDPNHPSLVTTPQPPQTDEAKVEAPAPQPPADPALEVFGPVAKTWAEPHPGMRHLRFSSPQHKGNIVEIDLNRPEYSLTATRPDEAGKQTVRQFAQSRGAIFATNGDLWDVRKGQPRATLGLAMGDGILFPGSADDRVYPWNFLACDVNDVCRVSAENQTEGPRAGDRNIIGGQGASVTNHGRAVHRTDNFHGQKREPRLAFGVTADNKLIVAAVDGRRGDAIGATFNEMGVLMEQMGAQFAFLPDGGGSLWVEIDGQRLNGLPAGQSSGRTTENNLGVVLN